MRPAHIEIHGAFNFRWTTLDVVAVIEYIPEEYLSVSKLLVFSERRNCMVEASERMALKFQEANWDYLEVCCSDEYHQRAYQAHLDRMEAIGDMKCHERMETKTAAA